MTIGDIAREIGRPRQTVSNRRRELGLGTWTGSEWHLTPAEANQIKASLRPAKPALALRDCTTPAQIRAARARGRGRPRGTFGGRVS